ncbi:hypothetical protein PHLCEN_2v8352 [Hermanssonia centrifuga]|uniref:Uncharacterized protein n=1 Tax=Hermanssonia centrifuga TaxID=98765 RepID=A0A2R6NU24_9APHY|nr:hypothetical protein PHLCEN_2v8352 [Hermanssonia centrifuga]
MRSYTESKGQINKCTNLINLNGPRYKSEIVCVWRCVASDFASSSASNPVEQVGTRELINRFVE